MAIKESVVNASISIVVLSVVVVAVISFVVWHKKLIGPVLILLGLLPLAVLGLAKRSIASVAADLVFGMIDTGILGIAALIGASFAGVLGAIVGGAAGDAITDGFAGIFEGRLAQHLRRKKIKEARTPLSASLGKMAGCLIGIGLTLTVAWSLLGL